MNKYTSKEDRMRALEEEFYAKVTQVLADRITPIYNSFLLFSAATFAYFVVLQQNQCYAKEKQAYALEYSETVDVTSEFYWLSVAGMLIMIASALVYYLQSMEDMYAYMRPWTIIANVLFLAWFVSLQVFRLRETGRACSGDYFIWADKNGYVDYDQVSQGGGEVPDNYKDTIIREQGQWLLIYIVL